MIENTPKTPHFDRAAFKNNAIPGSIIYIVRLNSYDIIRLQSYDRTDVEPLNHIEPPPLRAVRK